MAYKGETVKTEKINSDRELGFAFGFRFISSLYLSLSLSQ